MTGRCSLPAPRRGGPLRMERERANPTATVKKTAVSPFVGCPLIMTADAAVRAAGPRPRRDGGGGSPRQLRQRLDPGAGDLLAGADRERAQAFADRDATGDCREREQLEAGD